MLNSRKQNLTNFNFLGLKRKVAFCKAAKTQPIVTETNLKCNFKLKENRARTYRMKLSAIRNLNDSTCPKAPHNTTQYLTANRTGEEQKLEAAVMLDGVGNFFAIEAEDELCLTGGTMRSIGELCSIGYELDEREDETSVSEDKDSFFCLRENWNLETAPLEYLKLDLGGLNFMEKDVS